MRLFNRQAVADAEGYLPAAPAESVQPHRMTVIKANGQKIVLTRLHDEPVAFSAACPHAAGDLSEGTLTRGQITCPEHGFKFDIRTGRATWPEDETCRLKRYPAREEDGTVRVKLT